MSVRSVFLAAQPITDAQSRKAVAILNPCHGAA